VFYGLLALIMYVMYKNKYKPTKQKGTNEWKNQQYKFQKLF
jgi:hypothetical protein